MNMEPPPMLMDGARVIEYALFDPTVGPTGHVSVDVGGVPINLETVRGLVIAENMVEGGVFLLHCNEQWDSLAASCHRTSAAARESAEQGYAGVQTRWEPFRELTEQERAEVETVRNHLREMAAQFPNE